MKNSSEKDSRPEQDLLLGEFSNVIGELNAKFEESGAGDWKNRAMILLREMNYVYKHLEQLEYPNVDPLPSNFRQQEILISEAKELINSK